MPAPVLTGPARSASRLVDIARALLARAGGDPAGENPAGDDPAEPSGGGHDPAEPSGAGTLVAVVTQLDGPAIRGLSAGSDDGSAVDLMLRPLGGHPAEVLTGFTAPLDWSAVGVVGRGRSHRLDDSSDSDDETAAPFGDQERLGFAYLVARDGASASACTRADGTTWDHSATGLDGAAEGRIDDVLRRTLGLPTHPPPAGPIELWARVWLDQVLEAASARPARRWSWPAVALLHPAAQLVLDDLSGRRSEVVESMPRLAVVLANGRSWADLRTGYASGTWVAPAIPPDVAAWMDDGIFSRWLLDGLPGCGDALVALGDLLSERVMARIAGTLEQWEVPTATDPDPWRPQAPRRREPRVGGRRR
jgi:hypothetical protein